MSLNQDIEELHDNINKIIENSLDKKDFSNVILDTSFLAYIILEILIKNFNITDVLILENGKLEKAHPCECGQNILTIKHIILYLLYSSII